MGEEKNSHNFQLVALASPKKGIRHLHIITLTAKDNLKMKI
jgi:hypothetical protein